MLDLGIVEQDTSGIEMFAKEHDIDLKCAKRILEMLFSTYAKKKSMRYVCENAARGIERHCD